MDEVQKIESLIKAFNWVEPSWSLFIIMGWLGLSILYALAAGRGRVLGLLVSIYAAKLIALQAPILQELVSKRLSIETASLRQLAVFSVLFILIFFSLSKHGFKLSAEGRGAALVFAIIFSVLQVGLLASTVLAFLPSQVNQSFSPLIQQLFLSGTSQLFWLVAPIVFVVLFGRFVASRSET